MKFLLKVLLVCMMIPLVGCEATSPSILMLGDSYVLTSSWPTFATKASGYDNVYVEGVGGVGFEREGYLDEKAYTFTTLLDKAKESIPSDSLRQVKYILVLGGFNDYYCTQEVISERIQEFCAHAKTIYPSARVIIGMVGWHQSDKQVQNFLIGTKDSYQKAAGENGAYYLEGIEEVLRPMDASYFYEDGFHPNEKAGQAIGEYVGRYLRNIDDVDERAIEEIRTRFFVAGIINIGIILVLLGWAYWYHKRKKRIKNS